MVQAACSGVPNIAEGSVDAATSAKLELDLCTVSCKKEFREFIIRAENNSSIPLCTVPYKSVLVANSTILLIDTANYFLKRQMQRKSAIFLKNGGFAERMFKMRALNRKK